MYFQIQNNHQAIYWFTVSYKKSVKNKMSSKQLSDNHDNYILIPIHGWLVAIFMSFYMKVGRFDSTV